MKKIGIMFFWLLVWQGISMIVNNDILLVGPIETIGALAVNVTQLLFWKTVMHTLLRIGIGFFAALLMGFILAMLSGKYKLAEDMLAPVMAFMKAVPVASFVVLFLIWWRADKLATAISFCVVLPHIYVNTLEGIKSANEGLLEMAQVFSMPAWNRFFYIYRPTLKPFLESGIKISAGMAWKSGVAAEVIGTPLFSIGEQMYMDKILLDTAGVLSWTVVVICASVLFEKMVMLLFHAIMKWNPVCFSNGSYQHTDSEKSKEIVFLEKVKKSFDKKIIIENKTATYAKGDSIKLDTPSGSGKTTLLRLIAGLEKPDEGQIKVLGKLTYVFQEDRLCEDYSALINLEMVCGNRNIARKHLLQLLEEEDIHKPCKQLSGGMKRRVAIARAFCVRSDTVLVDEPFNGLDVDNRERVKDYIMEHGRDRLIITASHLQ